MQKNNYEFLNRIEKLKFLWLASKSIMILLEKKCFVSISHMVEFSHFFTLLVSHGGIRRLRLNLTLRLFELF